MSTDEYVEHAVHLRIAQLEKLLKMNNGYVNERRAQWTCEVSSLRLWLDCRMPRAS